MDVWAFIQHELSAGNRLMLLVVTDLKGSTPGKPGFKMAVSSSGELSGTIGGGAMEYNMVNLSRDLIGKQESDPLVVRQVHDQGVGKDSTGMLCAGMQIILLFPLEQAHQEVVNAIVESMNKGQTGVLDMTPDYFSFDQSFVDSAMIDWDMQSEDEWHYSEHIGVMPVLYIFGGGHLSLPVSQVFRLIGFKVIVYDDRPNLQTMTNNPYAHEKVVVDYRHAADLVSEGENSYVAIMTTSHDVDQMILGSLLDKELKYLGMIGSKKKVEKIFNNLKKEGASVDQLARVDSPMGIDVAAKTVEEIAISIAAGVIKVKNT